MGKWLEKVRQKSEMAGGTNPTKLTKAPSVGSVSAPPPGNSAKQGEAASPSVGSQSGPSGDNEPEAPCPAWAWRRLADSQPWAAAEAEEAAEERAAIVEEATGVSAEAVARASKRFYEHIFGPGQKTGCCRAAFDRYCDEGARLKREYDAAVAACDASFPEWIDALAKVCEDGGAVDEG